MGFQTIRIISRLIQIGIKTGWLSVFIDQLFKEIVSGRSFGVFQNSKKQPFPSSRKLYK